MSDIDFSSSGAASCAIQQMGPALPLGTCEAANEEQFNRTGASELDKRKDEQLERPLTSSGQGLSSTPGEDDENSTAALRIDDAPDKEQVLRNDAQPPSAPIAPKVLERLDSIADNLGAPVDRPRFEKGLSAVAAAVQCLMDDIEGANQASIHIAHLATLGRRTAARGAARKPLSRRRGRHLLYALLIALGERLEANASVDKQALQITAAWSLRAMLTGWMPAPRPLAQVSAVLLRPDSAIAKAWTSRGRGKCLRLALAALSAAIEANPLAARDLGLVVADSPAPSLLNPVEHAALLVRKRLNGLQTNAERRAVGGAGGHGTLVAEAIAEVGRELTEGLLARDKQTLMNYLWIVTHLSEHVVAELPVTRSDDHLVNAVAWIAVDKGEYCYRLYRLEERGAGTGDYSISNFEATEQVVCLELSPVAVEMLLQIDMATGRSASNVGELLGASGVSARSNLTGRNAYRITVRRVQESLPVLLLERGGNRWPILLATSSPFLVSVGRHSYGACPNRAIQAEFVKVHELLCVPPPRGPVRDVLIGSRVTPTRVAVQSLLGHLRKQADRNWCGLDNRQSVLRSIRAVAPWMSCIEALSLARRKRLVYEGVESTAAGGIEILVNDKKVREQDPLPLPVCSFLERADACYRSMLQLALQSLDRHNDTESQHAARVLRDVLNDTYISRVLDVDATWRLVPAGYLTWHDAAPPSLRLPGNFARQFWPLQALLLGLPQRLLDVLMRHQLADLHLGGRTATVAKKHIRGRLLKMLDQAMTALEFELPLCLRCFEG
jgi:hypothetical protein